MRCSAIPVVVAIGLFSPHSVAQCFAVRLMPDGAGSGRFGRGVDVQGDFAIVGRDWANGNRGEAAVFQRIAGDWTRVDTLAPADLVPNTFFGNDVAIEGDLAVIGGPFTSELGPSGHGTAYVFRLLGGVWTLEDKLFADLPISSESFGWDVDTDGQRVLIGTNAFSGSTGAVYVFEHQGGGDWAQTQRIVPPDASATDHVGSQVSIDAGTLAFSSRNEGPPGTFPGSVYVYTLNAGVWSLEQELTPDAPQPTVNAPFGGAGLDLQADTIVASASDYNPGMLGRDGEAFVFTRSAGVWSQAQALLPGFAADTGGLFGFEPRLSGDWLIVGAPNEIALTPAPVTSAGAAYVFRHDGTDFGFVRRLFASPPTTSTNLGAKMGFDGATLIGGAFAEDAQAGAAYIFEDFDPLAVGFDVEPDVSFLTIEITLPVFGTFTIDIPLIGQLLGEFTLDCGDPASLQLTDVEIRTLEDIVTIDLGMGSFIRFENAGQRMNAVDGDAGSPGQLGTSGEVVLDPVLQPFGTLRWSFMGMPGAMDMATQPDAVWLMGGTAIGSLGSMEFDFVVEPVTFTLDLGMGASNPSVTYSAVIRSHQVAACPGDIADDFGGLGGDGTVGFGDFLALLALVGPCPGGTPGCTGDIADDFGTPGGDGQVSFGDFLALLALVGPCP